MKKQNRPTLRSKYFILKTVGIMFLLELRMLCCIVHIWREKKAGIFQCAVTICNMYLEKKDILAVHKKLDSITHANEASEVSRLITSMILMPPVATLQLKLLSTLAAV